MIDEIDRAVRRERQYLSGKHKALFVIIGVLCLMTQFLIMAVTVAGHHYWILIAELPLLLLAFFGLKLIRAAATALDSPPVTDEPN